MPAKQKLDKEAAKIAFQETLELSARVAAFATANFVAGIGYGQIIRRAEELAQRDLVLLALSTRRLAELCELKQSLKKMYVAHVRPFTKQDGAGFYPIKKKSSVWTLIGVILHHLQFSVFKNDTAVKLLLGHFKEDIVGHYRALLKAKDITAVCYIQSDRGGPFLFSIAELVRLITDFIETAEEVLGDSDVYVGSLALD